MWGAVYRDPALVGRWSAQRRHRRRRPDGVESAGALAELYRESFSRDYPSLPQEKARIILVEVAPELFTMLKDVRDYAKKALEKFSVEVMVGELVSSVRPAGKPPEREPAHVRRGRAAQCQQRQHGSGLPAVELGQGRPAQAGSSAGSLSRTVATTERLAYGRAAPPQPTRGGHVGGRTRRNPSKSATFRPARPTERRYLPVMQQSWSAFLDTPGSGHGVQIYADVDELAGSVVSYVAAGWLRDEPAVLIATPDAPRPLSRRASARSAGTPPRSPTGVCSSGQTPRRRCARSTFRGSISTAGFATVVGGLVDRAAGPGRTPTRVFGEMVDLLAQRGRFDEAMALEDLWIEAAARTDASPSSADTASTSSTARPRPGRCRRCARTTRMCSRRRSYARFARLRRLARSTRCSARARPAGSTCCSAARSRKNASRQPS